MDNRLSNVFLIIVATGALLFTGYLILDYFSGPSRAARRKKKRLDKKLKRVRDQSGASTP